MKLSKFQEKSVEHIVTYLKNNDRALCADEAGLGKTIIAQGVIKKMAYEKLNKCSPTYKEIEVFLNGLGKKILSCWKEAPKTSSKREDIIYRLRNFLKEVGINNKNICNYGKHAEWIVDFEAKRQVDKFINFCFTQAILDQLSDEGTKQINISKFSKMLQALPKLAVTSPEAPRSGKNWNIDIPSTLNKYNYKVLYICSNLAIAEQNVSKLSHLTQLHPDCDRLSILWWYLEKSPTPYIDIYPITSTVISQQTLGNGNEFRILGVKKMSEEAREKGEKKSLEKFAPDLIIFDEFQNFGHIIKETPLYKKTS